jgi:uncharacterized PurR-regulated membrane protein YhhQ (DUF165 family)
MILKRIFELLYAGFELVIGFIEHFQIVTTSNYSAIANSHIVQFTTAHTQSSQFVFSSCFLVTDPNSVLSLRPY